MTTINPSPDRVFDPRKRRNILIVDHVVIFSVAVVLSAATKGNIVGPVSLAILFSCVAVLHANVAGYINHPCTSECEWCNDCGENGPCEEYVHFTELVARTH